MKLINKMRDVVENGSLPLSLLRAVAPQLNTEYEMDCYLMASTLGAFETNSWNDTEKLLALVSPGNKYTLEQKDITSFTDIRDENKAVVCFTTSDNEHWCYAERGTIVWDGEDNNSCRKYGKPTKAILLKENK